jgi:CRP-like cAMP-binding protein
MIEFLKSLQLLSDDELRHFERLIQLKELKKGDFLIQQGQICSEVVLIKSGVLRSFWINSEGDELTNCFAFEGDWMTAFSSFITQQPTDEYIQAMSKSELWVLKKTEMEILYEQKGVWQKIGRLLTEFQYIALEKRLVSFQKQSAKQRYEDLVEHYPNYISQIPLQYLASYLGITPRHLSRIRRGL